MVKNYFIKGVLLVLVIWLFYMLLNAPFILREDYILEVLIYATFGTVVFIFKNEPNESLRKQYFKISNLFLIGFCIVHFQIYIDFVLGNYNKFGHDYFIDRSIVSKSAIISTVSLFGFYLGYLIRTDHYRPPKATNQITSKKYENNDARGMVLLSFLFFLGFIVFVDFRYLMGGYGDVEMGTLAVYSQNYLILSLYGVILLKTREMIVAESRTQSFFLYAKYLGMPLLLLLSLYLPLVAISGDRGPIIQIALVFFGGYIIQSQKKYKLVKILGLCVLAIFVVSSMGFIRQLSDKDNYLEKVTNMSEVKSTSSTRHSFSPETMQLATSIRTMHAAVSYTDDAGYSNGIFQLYRLIGVVPGLGVVFKGLTGLEDKDVRSSLFLTDQIHGADNFGLGTTSIADIYLDFGPYGTFLFYILFGLFIRYLEEKSVSEVLPSLFLWIIIFTFLSKSVYIGRTAILSVVRDGMFTFLLVLIGSRISLLFFYKRRTTPKSRI